MYWYKLRTARIEDIDFFETAEQREQFKQNLLNCNIKILEWEEWEE